MHKEYPYLICYSFKRTSTIDHDYDPPILAKSFEAAYDYIKVSEEL